jgi:hypothetical protein
MAKTAVADVQPEYYRAGSPEDAPRMEAGHQYRAEAGVGVTAASFCAGCGTKSVGGKFCASCGGPLTVAPPPANVCSCGCAKTAAKFCSNCGTSLSVVTMLQPKGKVPGDEISNRPTVFSNSNPVRQSPNPQSNPPPYYVSTEKQQPPPEPQNVAIDVDILNRPSVFSTPNPRSGFTAVYNEPINSGWQVTLSNIPSEAGKEVYLTVGGEVIFQSFGNKTVNTNVRTATRGYNCTNEFNLIIPVLGVNVTRSFHPKEGSNVKFAVQPNGLAIKQQTNPF